MVTDALQQLREILNTGGIAEALPFLNRRVPHRFTAVYRLEGANLRMVHFYDRQGGQALEILRVVPLEHSFCQLAIRDGSFVTADSSEDSRLDGLPLQPVIESYIGFPLVRGSGELMGSFCHFDVVEHDITDEEFAFLQQAMAVLPGYLGA